MRHVNRTRMSDNIIYCSILHKIASVKFSSFFFFPRFSALLGWAYSRALLTAARPSPARTKVRPSSGRSTPLADAQPHITIWQPASRRWSGPRRHGAAGRGRHAACPACPHPHWTRPSAAAPAGGRSGNAYDVGG